MSGWQDKVTGGADEVVAGLDVYLVGGAVRDALLGRPVFDQDWVVVGATVDEMLSRGFRPVGRDFPVFLHPVSHEEYALARTERKTGHGYGGFTVNASPEVTLEEDLSRRDLTVNAIARAPDGTLVDPFSGVHDCHHRRFRHVSDAFVEDPLRVVRLARFMARYAPFSFEIDESTRQLLLQMVRDGEVGHLVAERVWQETEKALGEVAPVVFFEVLAECGALAPLFGETATTSRFDKGLAVLPSHVLEEERWAALWQFHAEDEIVAINQRLKVPKRFMQLSLVLARTRRVMASWPTSTSGWLDWLNGIDAWRKEERARQAIAMLECEVSRSADVAMLGEALEAARSVSPQALVQQGFKGPAMGEALAQARAEAIRARLGLSS
ncbi:polynucleotide adenylyltransferase [Larsenimonas rhizosphaerae]|uniref:polynucleotide adenylyltransferase n=1 Tax=Larsenimonas rhizosphaerae TaxID=2944682 RepID=UPI0025470577|nr:polynucleotide adenylyltransferase [Larsenimonas rhizosphaerae]